MLFSWAMICIIIGILFSPVLTGIPILFLGLGLLVLSVLKNLFGLGRNRPPIPITDNRKVARSPRWETDD